MCTTSKVGGKSSLFCVQDVMIKNKETARVLFDGGSEITLVQEGFAKQRKLSWRPADYTLQGIGSSPIVYISISNGKVDTFPIVTMLGERIKLQAYGVNEIITKEIQRDQRILKKSMLPYFFHLLIEAQDLFLISFCSKGFGCQDCCLNRCMFHSLFGMGWVSEGKFKAQRRANPTTIRKVALFTSKLQATGSTACNPTTKAPGRAISLKVITSNPTVHQGLTGTYLIRKEINQ